MIERTVFMLLAICGCFSFQPFAFADVYQGYIGRYPVVMHFASRDPETIQGRYFYTRVKQDILLIGHETKGTETSKNDDITLTSKETGDKFWLKRHGDGYQGIFEKLHVMQYQHIRVLDPSYHPSVLFFTNTITPIDNVIIVERCCGLNPLLN